jgi:hypothetical protein
LVFGNFIPSLPDQLIDIADETEKHVALEHLLLKSLKIKTVGYDTAKISAAVQQIINKNGHIEISTLHKNQFM